MADIPLRVKPIYDGRQLDQGLNKLQRQTQAIKQTMAAAFGAFISIQAIRGIGKAADETFKLQNAIKALDTQMTAAGYSMDNLLASLQDVTKQQVAMRDLVGATNRAVALLGTDAIPRFEELAEVAAKASSVMGTSVTQAFDDIVTGIGRQSRMILDNLGIIVSTTTAYENYANSIGVATAELDDAQKKQAFLNEVVDQAKRKYGDLAVEVNPMQQLAAAWIDMGDAIASLFVGMGAGGGIEGLSRAIKGFGKSLENVDLQAIKAGIQALLLLLSGRLIISAIALTSSLTGGVTALALAFGQMSLVVAPVIVALYGWNTVIRDNKEALDKLRESFDDSLDDVNDFTREINLNRTAIDKWTEAGSATTEQLEWLKGKIKDIIAINPSMVTELGYTIDAEGRLADAGGVVLDSLDDLSIAFDDFSTAIFRGEVDDAIDKMNEFAEEYRSKLILFPEEFEAGYAERRAARQTIAQDPSTPLSQRLNAIGQEMADALYTKFNMALAGGLDILGVGETAGISPERFEEEVSRMTEDIIDLLREPEVGPPIDRTGARTGAGGRRVPTTAQAIAREELAIRIKALNDHISDTNARMQAWGGIIDDLKSIGATEVFQREHALSLGLSQNTVTENYIESLRASIEDIISFGSAIDEEGNIIGLTANQYLVLNGLLDKYSDLVTNLSIATDKLAKEALAAARSLALAAEMSEKDAAATEAFNRMRKDQIADARRAPSNIESLLGGLGFGDIGGGGLPSLMQLGGGIAGKYGGQGGQMFGKFASDISQVVSGNMNPYVMIGNFLGGFLGAIFGGGKEPRLEIEQPIDVNIIDIETRLMSFFNFRGMDPFTFSSSFKPVFENGLH